MKNFKSKFEKLYSLVMEQISDKKFDEIKVQAKKEAENFTNKLSHNEVLNNVLNLSSQKDFDDFLMDTYRTIIKGSKEQFTGDVRQLSTNLKIEDQKKFGFDKLSEKSKKFKDYKKEHPEASLEDYKISIIRNNVSKLDDIAKLYAPEFRQLMKIYENRNKLGISIDELIDKNIIDTIYEKYKNYELSHDFIETLFNFNNITKNGANIGKGEFIICLFVKGSEWPVDNCDVAIDGKKYEVKGSLAKVGESNSPIDILNDTVDKIKQDYLLNVPKEKQIDIQQFNIFKDEMKSNTKFREAFNFIRSSTGGNIFTVGKNGSGGIIGIIRKLYDYENCEDKNKIDDMIKSYLNNFYSKNIQNCSDKNILDLADIQSNNYKVLEDKFYLKFLEEYKRHLDFEGIIYIGDDHIFHLFDGSSIENIFNKMEPFIDRNYPTFTKLEKQNFANRIVMKK